MKRTLLFIIATFLIILLSTVATFAISSHLESEEEYEKRIMAKSESISLEESEDLGKGTIGYFPKEDSDEAVEGTPSSDEDKTAWESESKGEEREEIDEGTIGFFSKEETKPSENFSEPQNDLVENFEEHEEALREMGHIHLPPSILMERTDSIVTLPILYRNFEETPWAVYMYFEEDKLIEAKLFEKDTTIEDAKKNFSQLCEKNPENAHGDYLEFLLDTIENYPEFEILAVVCSSRSNYAGKPEETVGIVKGESFIKQRVGNPYAYMETSVTEDGTIETVGFIPEEYFDKAPMAYRDVPPFATIAEGRAIFAKQEK